MLSGRIPKPEAAPRPRKCVPRPRKCVPKTSAALRPSVVRRPSAPIAKCSLARKRARRCRNTSAGRSLPSPCREQSGRPQPNPGRHQSRQTTAAGRTQGASSRAWSPVPRKPPPAGAECLDKGAAMILQAAGMTGIQNKPTAQRMGQAVTQFNGAIYQDWRIVPHATGVLTLLRRCGTW